MTNRHVTNSRVTSKPFSWYLEGPGPKLNSILNSYILFNDRQGFAEITGYKSVNNYKPLSKISRKRLDMIYESLAFFASACLDTKDFCLDTFLKIYDSVSETFKKYLVRSRTLNRHKVANLQDFLSYCAGLKSRTEVNKWIVNISDRIMEELPIEHIPMLILMILEILPSYGSQKGTGSYKKINIDDESHRALMFYENYIGGFHNSSDINELFRLSFQKDHYLNRLLIIDRFCMYLNRYIGYRKIIKKYRIAGAIPHEELTNVCEGIQAITPKGIEILCKNGDRYQISAQHYPKVHNLYIKDVCQVFCLGQLTYIIIDKINLFVIVDTQKEGIIKISEV